MKKSKISVIIPVYNVENYIEKCITSLLQQTYTNLEFLFIIDGSLDASASICEKYAKEDSRIKVIYKENGGQASARNVGLDYATGEYVNFIDPDDYIEPIFYEYLLNLATTHHADIAECSFVKFYLADQKIEKICDDTQEEILCLDNLGALNRLLHEDFNVYLRAIVTWNKIYKKSLFNTIRFSTVRIYEELDTVYKLLYTCQRFVTSNKPLYTYVQRKDSTLGRPFSKERFHMIDSYQNCISFLKERGLSDLQRKAEKKYFSTCIRFLTTVNDSNTVLDRAESSKGLKLILKEYFDNLYKSLERVDEFYEQEIANFKALFDKEFSIEESYPNT
ncbi:MAG: glycosyltransferase family 2 protein [Clostridia bacterium]